MDLNRYRRPARLKSRKWKFINGSVACTSGGECSSRIGGNIVSGHRLCIRRCLANFHISSSVMLSMAVGQAVWRYRAAVIDHSSGGWRIVACISFSHCQVKGGVKQT
jgi:hypothetical protein